MFPQDDETVETILLAGEKSKVNIVKEFINKTTKEMVNFIIIIIFFIKFNSLTRTS